MVSARFLDGRQTAPSPGSPGAGNGGARYRSRSRSQGIERTRAMSRLRRAFEPCAVSGIRRREASDSRRRRKTWPLYGRSVVGPRQRRGHLARRQESRTDTALPDVRPGPPAFPVASRIGSEGKDPLRERGGGPNKIKVSESDCLREALFAPWRRPDATSSFRWDPNEDVRYALRARDPTDAATKETTQHGANRLASVGLSVLTVVPRLRSGEVRLAIPGGGAREAYGGFAFGWPIWRHPMSLAGIRALLAHPHLDRPEVRSALGVVEHRWARRISPGRFMNFTRAGS